MSIERRLEKLEDYEERKDQGGKGAHHSQSLY